jgi:hypothetical protein
MFGGCIYNLDSHMSVIPMLVFPVCWDDEKVYSLKMMQMH